MTVSSGTRTTPPRCHGSPFSSWSFVGILLAAVVLLLATSSAKWVYSGTTKNFIWGMWSKGKPRASPEKERTELLVYELGRICCKANPIGDACDDPPRFQSMMLKGNPQPPYVNGYKIEYKCRPGYMPLVPPLVTTAVCQADGTWTPLQEACTRKSCRNLGDPLNGRVSGSFQYGSQAHFSCNEGYFLIGQKTLYCELFEDTVDWSDEPPVCEKMLCEPPKAIPNGKYTSSHKDTFEYGEVVTYSCDPSGGADPYSLVGASTLVCSGQNVWSSDPPECKVVRCPYPTVKNGQMVSGFGTKYYYKAKVEFECLQGFSLKGSKTIVCEANNTWEPAIPECLAVPTPPSTKPPTTKPPSTTTSSGSGVKPPVSPTPPVSTRPGTSTLPPEPPSTGLGGGVIAAIVIAVVAAVAVCGTCVGCALKKKDRKEVANTAAYSAYQNKSSTPVEQTL